MRELTVRQREILNFIDKYLNENLQMPTLEEISEEFNISVTGVHYHLKALEKKNMLTVDRNSARGIRLRAENREKRGNISAPFFNHEPSLDEVDSGSENSIYIPRSLKLNSPFAFTVTSLSMQEAGIVPGDIAIMEKTTNAMNNDIVLAMIPDSARIELRRYLELPYFVALQAENEIMGSIKSQNVRVYGILKSLRRDYT